MSVATGGSEAAAAAGGGGGNRVFFQSPRGSGGSGGSSGGTSREDSVSAAAAVVQVQQRRHQQGKVTVKYDRKELRKRLVLEEWIVEQLGQLYGCEKTVLPPPVLYDVFESADGDLLNGPSFLSPPSEEKIRHFLSCCFDNEDSKDSFLALLASRMDNYGKGGAKVSSAETLVEYLNEEEEMPEVEIDIDDLLDAANEEERALKLQETLVDCYKPTEEFIKELLSRIRGMRKLSPPQKKSI